MATHIRVKREKTTYFLSTEAAETVLELKEKLQVLCGVSVDKQRLQLENGSVLEDASTVGDLKLETDCIVALTYAKGDEWESVNIETLAPAEEGEEGDEPVGEGAPEGDESVEEGG
uniref:Ubiquitin-like domain-containing protein n=1 Tax=Prasinoderma coloniale TaxID=156133 RepID=A0A7R9TXC8_9VIRI|eukprot:PRCOL_00002080-RA